MALAAGFSTCALDYEGLILDCDGVLVDTEPIHARSWREEFLRHGADIPEEYYYRFIGVTCGQMFDWLERERPFEYSGGREEIVPLKRGLYWDLLETDIREVPGAGAFLEAMARRVPLGMATSNPRETHERILRLMGWTDLFATIVDADCVEHAKPHPEVYERALAALGLGPRDSLVFEDSVPGVESARAAGLDVVGMTTYHDADALRSRGALATLDDFTDTATLVALLSRANA